MMIEIKGTQFINKGAELMLYAIIAKLHTKYPDVKITHEPNNKIFPYEKYSKLGIYPKANLSYKRVCLSGLIDFIPKKIRDIYGVVIDREINIVLDASGFAYSDQWGDNPTVRMAKLCKKWKKKSRKIVLLPQAFGPFTSERIKDAIKSIADNSDMIYARDRVSFDHLFSVTGKRQNIKIAPDFTILLPGSIPAGYNISDKEICVVPNYRMIDKTSVDVRNAYIPFLEKCIRYLIDHGKMPFFLIHEGNDDLIIAKNIIKNTGRTIPIVRESDPLMIKGILGCSKGIIGSRFHGLVSGLSQGVPSLATGWSHKYQMLFNDYGFDEGLINVFISDDALQNKMQYLVDDGLRQQVSAMLIEKSSIQKDVASKMWEEVFDIIAKDSL
jgi:polysaccharide pyruvyl transferase WcaK-like protein